MLLISYPGRNIPQEIARVELRARPPNDQLTTESDPGCCCNILPRKKYSTGNSPSRTPSPTSQRSANDRVRPRMLLMSRSMTNSGQQNWKCSSLLAIVKLFISSERLNCNKIKSGHCRIQQTLVMHTSTLVICSKTHIVKLLILL